MIFLFVYKYHEIRLKNQDLEFTHQLSQNSQSVNFLRFQVQAWPLPLKRPQFSTRVPHRCRRQGAS